MIIAVTGADGQIGSELQHISSEYDDYTFHFLNREKLDITNQKKISKFFQDERPNILINCAAYTAVDKAEEEKEKAKDINTTSAGFLAKACLEHDCKMIHYSTDYVYHLKTENALKESDNTTPKGIYAKTKLEGENIVLTTNPKTLVIRTSWVYSSFGNNFVKTMLRLGENRESLNIVSDQIGTPTYARDIASMTLNLVEQIVKPGFDDYGVYNYSNLGITNWAEFAQKIFELENITCEVYPITTVEFGAKAHRPLWSVLAKEKIKSVFGIKIPYWEDSLKKCLKELKNAQH